MLPYWMFNVQATLQYAGTVELSDSTGQGPSNRWQRVTWTSLEECAFPPSLPAMQVYASYEYRRDFGEAMKAGFDLSSLQPLPRPPAHADELRFPKLFPDAVPLHGPGMRASLAWELALRALREKEVRGRITSFYSPLCHFGNACILLLRHHVQSVSLAWGDAQVQAGTSRLKEEHKAERVKDVDVVISPVSRQAFLVFLPAYGIDYTHGETFNVHGERHPQHFRALVSGLGAQGSH